MDKFIDFVVRQRLLVVLFALIVAGSGFLALRRLPIDAFPDVTPVLVQIFTEAEGLAPEEVEKLITYPIEVSMNGLPGITDIRSLSTFGLSVVSIYFDDKTDIYFARQLVFERLQAAREEIPAGLGDPEMGPITTGLGQVYQYIVEGEGYELMELRTIEDWIVKYQLRTVPGVTEVLSFGGLVKQFQIRIDPNLLLKYELTLDELVEAVKDNNRNTGGSFLVRGAEEYLVRGLGWVHTVDDIANIKIASRDGGVPIYVRNVAEVVLGPEIRRGIVTRNGEGEVVSGIVLKLIGQNTTEVIDNIKRKITQINAQLPEGVRVVPYYDQADLVDKAVGTVKDALFEGAVLIVIVLFIFLWNARSALVVLSTLPLSALVSFILMDYVGMSANLMSLGGLAIGVGMMVDGSIVMVENIFRHLTEGEGERVGILPAVSRAAQEVARPIVFAIGIIIIVFLPLFTLQEVEGKLFAPMAFTISFAMLGSLIFSLTLVPVLCTFVLKGRLSEKESPVLRVLKRFYLPTLHWAIRRRKTTVAIASGALVCSLFLVPFLGTEFVPILEEGSMLVRATMAPSTSLVQAKETTLKLEKILLGFPEVKNVLSKVGRAEIGGDPEPVNNSEIFVELAPPEQWTTARTKEGLIEKMREKLLQFPGILLNVSQPIAIRVDELISGVKAQLAIKIFGDDLDVLILKAGEVQRVISQVAGVADLQVEQVAGQPQVQVAIDRGKLARYGINVSEVQDVIRTAIGGSTAGQVFEGQRRFDIFIRLKQSFRNDVKAIGNILVSAPNGSRIPLSQLAEIQTMVGPKQISRENNRRRVVIQCNIKDRDMGSFVAEARRLVEEQVDLPAGYLVTWGGQFENQQRAMKRLIVIVPLTVFLIFIMLFSAFNSVRNALLIVLNVPFAMTGGIVALFVTGLYLSVPASVGFIALFGVAVLNGVVMVSCINQLRAEGMSLEEAVVHGSELRLRPVMMTALVASLGLIPLLFSSGIGSEVQRPLATVVVGGLITSTLLTLFVLPTLYGWFEQEAEEIEL